MLINFTFQLQFVLKSFYVLPINVQWDLDLISNQSNIVRPDLETVILMIHLIYK